MRSDRGRLTRQIKKLPVSLFISSVLSLLITCQPVQPDLVKSQGWMIFKSDCEDDAAQLHYAVTVSPVYWIIMPQGYKHF